MKLKYLFLLLVFMLMFVWLILLKVTITEQGMLFYLTEGVITFSLFYLIYFYRKVVKPLDNIANGMDLLREQDFGSRLKEVGQPEADRVVQVFNKMMGQLKDERLRLREQNHFLDLLIAVSPMGVVIMDYDSRITMTNQAALRFLGFTSNEEIEGKTFEELEDNPLVDEILRMSKGETRTIRLSDAMIYRCSRLSFIDKGFAHPFILIESLTSEMVKAEKKAYEKVIRMIAHEVNNTVGGVTSALDTVKDMLSEWDEGADLQEVMTVCIERGLKMSRFITNFANVVKIPEPQRKNVCLNGVIEECKAFVETLGKNKHIDWQFNLCDEKVIVSVDQVLFEQVLVNIIKNAVESINSSGTVIIKTSLESPMLEIADNGTKIPREVENKLFTPFFSTKPNGQGIGLLFIREVLDRHGCTFSLRTYSDGWTKFRISFPKID